MKEDEYFRRDMRMRGGRSGRRRRRRRQEARQVHLLFMGVPTERFIGPIESLMISCRENYTDSKHLKNKK